MRHLKKTAYQKEHEDIAAIIAEVKVRKGWTDKEVGKLIGPRGIKAGTLKDKRVQKTLPNMRFCDVAVLADAAGYDIKFQKREVYR